MASPSSDWFRLRTSFSTPLVVVGSLLVAGTGFLPWGASGRAERSSYAIVTIVDRLDILDGVAAALAPAWFLAPVAAAVVWTAAALGRALEGRRDVQA